MEVFFFFFFKQKTAYEIRKGDWSSDVCSSDLAEPRFLDDLVGHGLRRDVHPRDAAHRGAELVDEHHEGRLVARAQQPDERDVIGRRPDRRHRSRSLMRIGRVVRPAQTPGRIAAYGVSYPYSESFWTSPPGPGCRAWMIIPPPT